MNDIKKKSVILSVIVLLMGLMIAGGTFAFMTLQANVTNTNYVGVSTCFLVDYNIDNGDGTQNIEGTLFPSLSPVKGLNGRVGLKVNEECEVNGIGAIKLHINSETNSHLTEIATSHCEDKKTGDILTEYATEASCSSANQSWKSYPTSYCESNSTLQTLKEYTTSASCTSHNGTWVTNGSPLKYAVYNTNNTNGSPVKVGHITSNDIGSDITIYDDIILTHDQRYFYVYIWIDGYLTDNSHADLPFDGYISASATQNDQLLPSEYQQIEWLGSTGTQYIDTGFIPNNRTDFEISFEIIDENKDLQRILGGYNDNKNCRYELYYKNDSSYGFNYYMSTYNSSTSPLSIEIEKKGDTLIVNNQTINLNNINFNGDKTMYLFASSRDDTLKASMKLYHFKLYDETNLIRDFIPCYRKSDNVRGLYDTIEGKFYTNAGTGTFEIPT